MRGQVSRSSMHLLGIIIMTLALASLKSPQNDKGNFRCQTEQCTLLTNIMLTDISVCT